MKCEKTKQLEELNSSQYKGYRDTNINTSSESEVSRQKPTVNKRLLQSLIYSHAASISTGLFRTFNSRPCTFPFFSNYKGDIFITEISNNIQI